MIDYDIRFHTEANIEYVKALVWYAEQKDGLEIFFKEAVKNKLSLILLNPYAYKKVKKNFRQVSVPDFPFVIVYYISRNKNLIVISSIFHTSRNPKNKYRHL